MYNGSELWKNRISFELIEKILPSGRSIETYPDLPVNIYHAVLESARHNPGKTAIEDSFGHRFSYGELADAADRFAASLKHQYKVCKGSHIALMMYSSVEFCVAFLAIVKLGAIAVMLPTKYKKKEICALVDKADLQYVICDTDYSAYFDGYRDQGITFIEYHSSEECFAFKKMIEERYPDAPPEGGIEDVSVMMFTSGTVSLSKAVMLPNYSYMHAVATYQKIFSVTAEDSTVIPVPVYMITGLSALFGLMLFAGGTVYMQQFFQAKEVLKCVRDRRVTFMHAAPTVYSLLLEEREEFPELPSLRCLACGGGRTSKQMISKMHDWLPDCEFRTVYGMTETSSPATILPENAFDSPETESNGIPIPGMRFRIVDESGNEAAAGQQGEILVSGTNLLEGYYKLDTPQYRDDWLHTGDVGYFTKEGYCHVIDRIKDMINRGGEKIISSDVEKELLQMDGIADAAVVGIPHEIYGEVPAAVVKLDKGSTWEEESIQKYLKGRIAGYKVPVKILFMDEIPLTPNGKVDKKNIKDLFNLKLR